MVLEKQQIKVNIHLLVRGTSSLLKRDNGIVLNIPKQLIKDNQVIIDTGSNINLVNDKTLVKHYIPLSSPSNIMTINSTNPTVCGKGILSLKIGRKKINLETLVLNTDVSMLLSTESLEDHQIFVNNEIHCLVDENSKPLVETVYRLGVLMIKNPADVTVSTTKPINYLTLHEKLGHLPNKQIKQLFSDGKLVNVTNEDVEELNKDQECSDCLITKTKAKPHYRNHANEFNARFEPMECWSFDVTGPYSDYDLHYILTMVDNTTNYTIIRFLENKSKTSSEVNKIIQYVERQFGVKIKVLVSDNAPENFSEQLTQQGIIQRRTTAYDHKENNRVEARHGVLISDGKTNFESTYKLPKALFKYSVQHGVNIRNLIKGDEINTSKLIKFGTIGVRHFRKKSKLDNHTEIVAYLGEDEQHFGSLVYLYKRNIVTHSSSVRWFKHQEQGKKCVDDLLGNNNEVWNYDDLYGDNTEEVDEESDDIIEPVHVDPVEEDKDMEMQDESNSKAIVTKDSERKIPSELVERTEYANPSTIDLNQKRKTRSNNVFLCIEMEVFCNHYLFCGLTGIQDPANLDEALKEKGWRIKTMDEMEGFYKLKVIVEEVEDPGDEQVVSTKWICLTKSNGKKKARCVARGFEVKTIQEFYSPTLAVWSLFLVLNIIVDDGGYQVGVVDAEQAFLNSPLPETILVSMQVPPTGETKIFRIQKALYGLKQAPRAWALHLNSLLTKIGFVSSNFDPALYYRKIGNDVEFILAFVDDCLLITRDFNRLVKELEGLFALKIVTKPEDEKYNYIGFNISSTIGKNNSTTSIEINKRDYIQKLKHEIDQDPKMQAILSKFKSYNSKTPDSPGFSHPEFKNAEKELANYSEKEIKDRVKMLQIMGGKMAYAVYNTRPDLIFNIQSLSKYYGTPVDEIFLHMKKHLMFIEKTQKDAIKIFPRKDATESKIYFRLITDASRAMDLKARDQLGLFVSYKNLGPIQFQSRTFKGRATSPNEIELEAIAHGMSQINWFSNIIEDIYGYRPQTKIFTDNKGAIAFLHAMGVTKNNKGIRKGLFDLRYEFNKDSKGEFQIYYLPRDQNAADLLTRNPDGSHFHSLKQLLFTNGLPEQIAYTAINYSTFQEKGVHSRQEFTKDEDQLMEDW